MQQQHLISIVGEEYANLRMEKTTAATNSNSKRRRVLSYLPTRLAIFAISTILLMSSLFAFQSNQSAWAGTFPVPNGQTNDIVHRTFISNAFAFWDLESENENIDIFVQPIFTGEDEDPQIELLYQRYEDSGERIEFGKALLTEDEFEIDKRLTEASLSKELDICFRENWDPETGECTKIDDTIKIDVQWEGTGNLERSSDIQKDVSDEGILIKIFEHQFREAEASGTIDGEDLGESTEANLQSDQITCITTGERTCDEDIEEEEEE